MVTRFVPDQGDIIVMDFDPQTGFEQSGRRPALVISNSIYNRHCKMALVCPITNTDKDHVFHVRLDKQTNTTGVILCDQIRALDVTARNAAFKERVPESVLDEAIDVICAFL
jgi:mRNA interferase MazF